MRISFGVLVVWGIWSAFNFATHINCGFTGISYPGPTPKQELVWSPASIRGLEMGLSRKADVIKTFGKPKSEDFPEGDSEGEPGAEWWMVYDSAEVCGKSGQVIVVLNERTAIVRHVLFYPLEMKRSEVISAFGKDFIITQYDFEPCDEENGGGARLYESKEGNLRFLEYRSKGIAVSFDAMEPEKVSEIQFVSKPIGSDVSQCRTTAQ